MLLIRFPFSKSLYQTKFIIETAQFYTAINSWAKEDIWSLCTMGQKVSESFGLFGLSLPDRYQYRVCQRVMEKNPSAFFNAFTELFMEPIGSAVDRYEVPCDIIVNTYPAPDFLLYAYHDPDPALIGMSWQKLVGKNPPGNFYRNALYCTIYTSPLSVRYWGSASCWYRSGSDLLLCDDQDPDPETTPNLGPGLRIRIRFQIRMQSGQWIRIRIRNPDPDPRGQKWPPKVEFFFEKYMFWSVGWPLLRAEGFFCNLDFLYGGLRIGEL